MDLNAKKLYCNPLPLEHYHPGKMVGKPGYCGPSYREAADPAILEFEGKYYLFPSAGLLWESDDLVDWHFYPIEPFDPGYAPTVVKKDGWIYLSASWDCSTIWRARHPHGPWEPLGTLTHDLDGNPTRLTDHRGRPVCWGDPCLFVDDDNSLYCYCNLRKEAEPTPDFPWRLKSVEGAIFGVKLKDSDPSCFETEPVELLRIDPKLRWQRGGESNQLRHLSIMEGAHVNKIRGRYYLQYSVNGTEYRNYAVGCAVSDSPLSGFVNQRRNPILIHRHGLVNGTAHHSLAQIKGGLWCFYTILFGNHFAYERRLGMDPAKLDENNELYIDGPSETPQPAPGETPEISDVKLAALTLCCPVTATGHAPGREPRYVLDQSIRTFYQAADAAVPQALTVDLREELLCSAVRIIFADIGLDYMGQILPGPYGWALYGSGDGENWEMLLDRRDNCREQHIMFAAFAPKPARYVKLEVTRIPPDFTLGIHDFTVFGPLADDPDFANEEGQTK